MELLTDLKLIEDNVDDGYTNSHIQGKDGEGKTVSAHEPDALLPESTEATLLFQLQQTSSKFKSAIHFGRDEVIYTAVNDLKKVLRLAIQDAETNSGIMYHFYM